MKRHLFAYLNHFALNLGALFACAWYALVPPQWTGHCADTIDNLARSNPARAFWDGLTG